MDIDARLKSLIAAGQASLEDMGSIGYAGVVQAKSAPNAPQIRMKSGDVEDLGDRVLRFRASDETTDRMGDIIRQSGWHLGNFKANPVILWAHDGDANPPVGKAVHAQVRDTASGPSLVMDIEFATAKQHALADTVYELAKGGYLSANSVGFLPIKTNAPESAEERKEMGLGEWGVEFVEAELLEDSIVSVPANPSAVQQGLRTLVGKGRIGATDAERFTDAATVTERSWEARLERIAGLIQAKPKAARHSLELKVGTPEILRELIDALALNTATTVRVEKELENLRYLMVPEIVRSSPSKDGSARQDPYADALNLLKAASSTTNPKE